MKKHLLTTTALVAAGVLAAGGAAHAQKKAKKPYITVNGYHEQVLGVTLDQDDNAPGIGDRSNLDVHGESEVHFNGHAKLDNGISLRAHWELEGGGDGAPGSDVIDETYIIVRGSFGQLTLGSEDNAGHLMTIGYSGSWATGVGQSLTFDVSDWIITPTGFNQDFDGTVNDARLRSGDNDSDKITYYTPRFAGFQLGASYIPETTQDSGGRSSISTSYHDGIALGANFVRKFDQFGLGVAAGYLSWQSPEGIAVPDADAWNVAVRLDFGGVRLSGVVKKNNDMRDTAGTGTLTSNSGTIWDVGARYMWGSNGISLTYAHGENEAIIATAGDDERDAAMLSYRRALGPGVRWTVNLMWAEYTGEVTGSTDDNDGSALTTSIHMAF